MILDTSQFFCRLHSTPKLCYPSPPDRPTPVQSSGSTDSMQNVRISHIAHATHMLITDSSSLSTIMVYYIRFLKLPKILTVDQSRSVVRALITITTDLGESIYRGDRPLWATLVSPDDNRTTILSRRDFLWKRGMRCLSIEMDHGQSSTVTWSARMVVCADRRATVDALLSDPGVCQCLE